MMTLLKIAFRNILRNRRRSGMTGSAVAAGAVAMLLFGGFAGAIFTQIETTNVERIGHLTVYRQGYFLFGAGNPAGYGIDHYRDVMALIANDPVLSPMINVITPTQSLVGIAGNFSGSNDAAKTFLGVGLVPSDRVRMREWDEYGTAAPYTPDQRMADNDETRGLIGGGLARILGLCAELKLADCPAPPPSDDEAEGPVNADVASLAAREKSTDTVADGMPQIDLLAATAQGAPNIVRLSVSGTDPQGVRELDDNYVAMHLALAQQLVYGRGEHKVTGIVLQLHRSEDLRAARTRVEGLIAAHKLPLEVRDFGEINPFYGQVVRLFGAIFLFIALVMGVIVLFAVVNTMTMNVMERTNEIGTIRALGLRRGVIRRQFVAEGLILGAIGATVGVVLALAAGAIINHAGFTWMPPGNANAIPLRVGVWGRPVLILGTWFVLVLVATLAALLPANRAAKLPVVDALRHV